MHLIFQIETAMWKILVKGKSLHETLIPMVRVMLYVVVDWLSSMMISPDLVTEWFGVLHVTICKFKSRL